LEKENYGKYAKKIRREGIPVCYYVVRMKVRGGEGSASQNIFSRYYYATAVSLINSIRDTAAVAVILNSINDHHQI
jgi:hypothetical protein